MLYKPIEVNNPPSHVLIARDEQDLAVFADPKINLAILPEEENKDITDFLSDIGFQMEREKYIHNPSHNERFMEGGNSAGYRAFFDEWERMKSLQVKVSKGLSKNRTYRVLEFSRGTKGYNLSSPHSDKLAVRVLKSLMNIGLVWTSNDNVRIVNDEPILIDPSMKFVTPTFAAAFFKGEESAYGHPLYHFFPKYEGERWIYKQSW